MITNLEVHKWTINETVNKHEDFIAFLPLCLEKNIGLKELSLDKIKSGSDSERLLMALLRRAILLACQKGYGMPTDEAPLRAGMAVVNAPLQQKVV